MDHPGSGSPAKKAMLVHVTGHVKGSWAMSKESQKESKKEILHRHMDTFTKQFQQQYGNNLSWATLPVLILTKIYEYLPILDKAHAAKTCRHWNQTYHLPELWRKFEFNISNCDTSYFKGTPKSLVKQVLMEHSQHLRYVTIKVDGHRQSAETACDILSSLVKCSLKTLELMSTAKPSFKMLNPDQFVSALTVVFVNSGSLSSLAIDETPVDDSSLALLAKGNQDTLTMLRMDSCPRVSPEGIIVVADQCRQLHELCIDYTHLTDELLTSLSRDEHVKLKYLRINIVLKEMLAANYQLHSISKESWLALSRHSPKLHLLMYFYVLNDENFDPFFHCEVPATHLFFGRSVSKDVMNRVGRYCPKLQELVVSANGHDPIDEELIQIANKCHNLESVGLGECQISSQALVHFAKICGKRLKQLFVCEEVLIPEDNYDLDQMSEEVSESIGRPWSLEFMPCWFD
ncbi:F-box/LRR-repeat protein 3-like [Amphiura filiformis]|uniref:F-box/LRR-repeat protein 3-like n=1 Tax=Amphiura filiformis TaxID=82378 RepID=UPI003B2236A5